MSYYKVPSLKFVTICLEKGFSQSPTNPDEDMKYENEGDAWS